MKPNRKTKNDKAKAAKPEANGEGVDSENVINLGDLTEEQLRELMEKIAALSAADWIAQKRTLAAQYRITVKDMESLRKEALKTGKESDAKDILSAEQVASLLRVLNEKFCVISMNGATRVLSYDDDDSHLVLQKFSDFRDLHSNKKLLIGTKQTSIGQFWLEHPTRLTYGGVVYCPGKGLVVGGKLNLWRGWGVEPHAGKWPLMQAHIKNILAKGNEEYETYILNWAAWAAQNPDKRAEVVLVLMGGEGDGKGVFLNGLCKIFGRHSKHISSMDQLTGKHNAHLRECSLLYVDEAYWAASKAGLGAFKRLITEETLFIEPKFIDAGEVPNYLKIVLSSNEKWVVPASIDARRFCVFRVSEEMQQNKKYFGPLYDERDERGGLAAMLHDLLARDLGDWHPRDIIQTDALLDQQLHSLSGADQLLVGWLDAGRLPGIFKNEVSNEVRSMGDDGIYKAMRDASPDLRQLSEHKLGSILKGWGCENRRPDQQRGWSFPPLGKMRAAWEAKVKKPWPWRNPGLEEWTVEPM